MHKCASKAEIKLNWCILCQGCRKLRQSGPAIEAAKQPSQKICAHSTEKFIYLLFPAVRKRSRAVHISLDNYTRRTRKLRSQRHHVLCTYRTRGCISLFNLANGTCTQYVFNSEKAPNVVILCSLLTNKLAISNIESSSVFSLCTYMQNHCCIETTLTHGRPKIGFNPSHCRKGTFTYGIC